MTREELREHCEKQIEMCEMWAISKGEKPSGKIYEEHKLILELLEQEPKTGHWILTDVEGYKVWHCNCSECGKDPQDYIGGSENWWLIKNNLPKFCPNCGSNNGEVEE